LTARRRGGALVPVPDAIRGTQPAIATPIAAVPPALKNSRRCIQLTIALA
jgi:hypothetical protein